ncbi:hypothetical protein K458DRAFT_482359 [Lentithecium fluviatile CBS 122367]|uniref:Heterokaryon incompatibility domain-containing protein n=1 Tax=Lentithecium fluviatile CBS 122367 TaxID=1168545 RepID=A0A6G1JM90_9PLEO|nr:hypothetical protein K458DRAFT_482359 [Lentithecium fluviatile CBS 122367]
MSVTSTCLHSYIGESSNGVRRCALCGTTLLKSPLTHKAMALASPQNSTNPVQYKYADLNLERGQEIRLVVIQPRHGVEPIRFNIIHVNLDDGPTYRAVPYTWVTETGDQSRSRLIHCMDGTVLPITMNCEAALRRFRMIDRVQHLWVDSICIHQENLKERKHQVGLMDQIYSKAMAVKIHINRPEYDFSLVFYWLKSEESLPIDHETECGVEELLNSRYFSRVWVIQEVVLANAIVLFVNNYSTALSDRNLLRLRSFCSNRHRSIPAPLERGLLGSRSLHACLDITKYSLASDLSIAFDYSLILPVVHTYAAVAILAQERTLGLIHHAIYYQAHSQARIPPAFVFSRDFSSSSRRDRYQVDTDLPSWVPLQWHSTVRSSCMWPWVEPKLEIKFKICLQKSTDADLEGLKRNTSAIIGLASREFQGFGYLICPRLRIRAHTIDKVGSGTIHDVSSILASKMQGEEWHNRPELSWVLPYFRRSCELCKSRRFNRGTRWWSDPVLSNEPCDLFAFLIRFAYDYRDNNYRILQTSSSIGFSSLECQKGDEVSAIEGAATPIILRHIQGGVYTVVGHCYLWTVGTVNPWTPTERKDPWMCSLHDRSWELREQYGIGFRGMSSSKIGDVKSQIRFIELR